VTKIIYLLNKIKMGAGSGCFSRCRFWSAKVSGFWIVLNNSTITEEEIKYQDYWRLL
jgi:hypothetical protein